jgi:hypothetical protein
MIARIKALLDVFASVILCNTYCFEHVARIERSEIRERQCLTANVVPAFRCAQCGLRRLPLETRRIHMLIYRKNQLETRLV